jgi:hypothetical protein
MTDNDKTPNELHGKVVEHPKLERDRALALFLARSHARNHGKPLPDPADIGPAVFTRLKPTMSREEIKENLLVALKANGFKIVPDPDPKDTPSTK